MRTLLFMGISLVSVQLLAAKVKFIRDVKPILENHCVRCHDGERSSRGVRLDRKQRALMSVVKKKPDDSILYTVARGGMMPPGPQKLTSAQLKTLRDWIAKGARWPDGVELKSVNPFVPLRSPGR